MVGSIISSKEYNKANDGIAITISAKEGVIVQNTSI